MWTNFAFCSCSFYVVAFLWGRRPNSDHFIVDFMFVVIMVLIDAAWEELSIGGLIVNFEYLSRCCHLSFLWLSGRLSSVLATFQPHFWLPNLTKSRYFPLIMRLIDRAAQGLSKTPLIIIIIGLLREEFWPLLQKKGWAGQDGLLFWKESGRDIKMPIFKNMSFQYRFVHLTKHKHKQTQTSWPWETSCSYHNIMCSSACPQKIVSRPLCSISLSAA